MPPRNREDMERLADSSGHPIIYRSGMNPKIQRNFKVFSPCDFIARITQHIPDKSFQLVRYYGWYSNKLRGQRLGQTDAGPVAVPEGKVIGAARDPPQPVEPVIEPGLDDPFPEYEIEAVPQARDGKLATRGAVSYALGARISRPPTGRTR